MGVGDEEVGRENKARMSLQSNIFLPYRCRMHIHHMKGIHRFRNQLIICKESITWVLKAVFNVLNFMPHMFNPFECIMLKPTSWSFTWQHCFHPSIDTAARRQWREQRKWLTSELRFLRKSSEILIDAFIYPLFMHYSRLKWFICCSLLFHRHSPLITK